MTKKQTQMKYKEKVAVLRAAVNGTDKQIKIAKAKYRKFVKNKSQCDFLHEVKIILGCKTWDEVASVTQIKKRALVNYRTSDKKDHRIISTTVLRRIFECLDEQNNDAINIPVDEQKVNQEDDGFLQYNLFREIKAMLNDLSWHEFADLVKIDHRALLSYILPKKSKNYRNMTPLLMNDIQALKTQLLLWQSKNMSIEDRLKNVEAMFEVPYDIQIDLTDRVFLALS